MMDEGQKGTENRQLKNTLSGDACAVQQRTASTWGDPGLTVGSTFDYNEPLQGTCNDCYFIAALISVAWAKNNLLKIFPNYQFYDTVTRAWSPAFAINKQLALDSAGQLVYARTRSGELWPCLYEKAYAMWKNNNLTNNNPNMATICGGGNGLTALQEITGKPLGPANTMPPFLANGNTRYPATAQTNASPSHTYSVLKKVNSNPVTYLFYNPCGGQTLTVTATQLSTQYSAWGYVNTD
jgi:Calpain family cysteine protease